jgi:uncharacterized membrane protein YphA (DoxX/SURF4 family)
LLILLGFFFVLNGLNYLFNRLTLEEYAHRQGLMSPGIMVFLSGLLLIFGRLSLMTGYFKLYGIVGLTVFLVVATFTIHQLWREIDRNLQMLEAIHFPKTSPS